MISSKINSSPFHPFLFGYDDVFPSLQNLGKLQIFREVFLNILRNLHFFLIHVDLHRLYYTTITNQVKTILLPQVHQKQKVLPWESEVFSNWTLFFANITLIYSYVSNSQGNIAKRQFFCPDWLLLYGHMLIFKLIRMSKLTYLQKIRSRLKPPQNFPFKKTKHSG